MLTPQEEQLRRGNVRDNLQALLEESTDLCESQEGAGYLELQQSLTAVFIKYCGPTHGPNIAKMVCLRWWTLVYRKACPLAPPDIG